MNELIKFIMGSDTALTIEVAIRLSLVYACLGMLKELSIAFARGVKN